MSIKNFYELDCWKQAMDLSCKIYHITQKYPKSELFGLTSQLKRASTSVAANIAEGFGRFHFKDKARFYYQARGSVSEVQNFLLLSQKLEFIDRSTCLKLFKQTKSIYKLVNGLIRSNSEKSRKS